LTSRVAFSEALDGGGVAPGPGYLVAHGGARKLFLRAWLQHPSLRRAEAFFDRSALGTEDEALMDRHVPAGSGARRVLVAGHTHAAREVHFDDGRSYINTGTPCTESALEKLAAEALAEHQRGKTRELDPDSL
jgi:hypothetical protein